MSTEFADDTRSPWYECYEPQTQPVAAAVPAPEAPEPADEDGAIEALFDYYNA